MTEKNGLIWPKDGQWATAREIARTTFFLDVRVWPENVRNINKMLARAVRAGTVERKRYDGKPAYYRPIEGAVEAPKQIKLGVNQQACLRALKGYGRGERPYPGGGWIWSGHATTVRLLDTLVRKGLVEIKQINGQPQYTLTALGREWKKPND